MEKLRKLTLEFDEKKSRWPLTDDKTDRVIKTFATKEDATAGGVLRKLLGADGGSVKIQLKNGKIQEERTFPKSKDPKKSPG